MTPERREWYPPAAGTSSSVRKGRAVSRTTVLTTVLVLVLVGVGGCGRGEDAVGTSPTGTEPDPGDTCKGGETHPLTLEELLTGLRDAGYNVYLDPACDRPRASWGISNFSVLVPELRPGDFERARNREGALACQLYDHVFAEPSASVGQHPDDEYALAEVLNVSCYIYLDPEKRAQQVARFENALNRLAAAND